MHTRKYLNLYNSILVKKSPLHGYGAFATRKIKKGTILYIPGFTPEEFVVVFAPVNKRYSRMQVYGESLDQEIYYVDKTVWTRSRLRRKPTDSDWPNRVNHACTPNVGLKGLAYVAIRAIVPGEELRTHYAFFDLGQKKTICRCGTQECNGAFSGNDWKDATFQRRYYPYMSMVVQHRVLHDLIKRRAWRQFKAISARI